MDMQLPLFNMTKKKYINPINHRVNQMKQLVRKYRVLVCRDIESFALDVTPFKPIRKQFQIGHLQTLRYISFPRDLVDPSIKWIEGFIIAAEEKKLCYKNHVFQE